MEKFKKRVSVCMATYNGSAFLEAQISSILCQLGPNDELVISDDGSTDETINIINGFADSRINLIKNGYFRSAIFNFQNALKHAKGEYIFLSDQDDIWYPDKINLVMSLLENYDLVMTDCCVVGPKGNIIHKSYFRVRGSSPGFWKNLWKNSYMGCCMAFRKKVLSYSLPFPRHIHMHDWWIGLMTEKKGSVYFLHQPLIRYNRHGGNLSPTGQGSYNWVSKVSNRLWMSWYVFQRTVF